MTSIHKLLTRKTKGWDTVFCTAYINEGDWTPELLTEVVTRECRQKPDHAVQVFAEFQGKYQPTIMILENLTIIYSSLKNYLSMLDADMSEWLSDYQSVCEKATKRADKIVLERIKEDTEEFNEIAATSNMDLTDFYGIRETVSMLSVISPSLALMALLQEMQRLRYGD